MRYRLRRTVGGSAGLDAQGALRRRMGRAGVMVRMVLIVGALGLLIGAAWIGSHAAYHSWHPCDWLLQDTVDRVLERRGIDPDMASIPLKAEVSEASEVQIVLRLRSTPLQCVSTWAAGRIFP